MSTERKTEHNTIEVISHEGDVIHQFPMASDVDGVGAVRLWSSDGKSYEVDFQGNTLRLMGNSGDFFFVDFDEMRLVRA